MLGQKVAGAEPMFYISHSSFDVKWVPVEMVMTWFGNLEPYPAVRMVLMWLRSQSTIPSDLHDIAERCHQYLKSLSPMNS